MTIFNSNSEFMHELPSFLLKSSSGLEVDPSKLKKECSATPGAFSHYIQQLFGQGLRFYGLDYSVFSELVVTPEKHFLGLSPFRLASDIVPFPEQRQNLYKSVRFLDENFKAEYIFQAVEVDVAYKQPIYGEKQADGSVPVTAYENRTRQEDAVLDVDEFIAAMWLKGIRCGLQMEVITQALFSKKINRLVIALGQSAAPSKNADVADIYTPIRQSNTSVWVNGKLDLRRFQNKYPPVVKGRGILQKIPFQLGRLGFTVTAERIEPPAPQDLDLSVYAGAGTTMEETAEGQILTAAMDGYICWDAATQKLSITEHIESQVDINVKNTGDMALAANQFISHGEVQEARLVKGKNMRFTAPVYGNLLSDGGHILLEDILSGGSAIVKGEGSIAIPKRVLNARIVSVAGQIDLNYAENCLVVGDVVTIGKAVHCVVVANTLHIADAKACTVAGNALELAKSTDHKSEPTKLWVFKPDLKADQSRLTRHAADLQIAQTSVAQKLDELATIKKNSEFAHYLQLRETMQGDPQQITPEMKDEFAVLQRTQAPHLKTIERLVKELQKHRSAVTEQSANIKMLKDELQRKCAEHFCIVSEVAGETVVYALDAVLNLPVLADKTLKEVVQWLQTIAVDAESVFAGQEGRVDWKFIADF